MALSAALILHYGLGWSFPVWVWILFILCFLGENAKINLRNK